MTDYRTAGKSLAQALRDALAAFDDKGLAQLELHGERQGGRWTFEAFDGKGQRKHKLDCKVSFDGPDVSEEQSLRGMVYEWILVELKGSEFEPTAVHRLTAGVPRHQLRLLSVVSRKHGR